MIVDKVWESVGKLTGRVPERLNRSLTAAFQNSMTIRAAEYAARLALGFLLSSARIFGNFAPFGIGISASGAGLETLAILGGCWAPSAPEALYDQICFHFGPGIPAAFVFMTRS